MSPVGVNIAIAAFGLSTGDVSFDPASPIQDASASMRAATVGYFRSINFLGRSANVAVRSPYVWGTLEGTVLGEAQMTRRSGLGDPRVRFAVNLYGAPAMELREFASYQQKTNIGVSVVVVAPLGQYDPSKLINIGANRWAFKPEIGVSHALGKWDLDLYVGGWFFTDNDDFRGMTREQDAIVSTQLHVSYSFRPRLWAAFDANFYSGGRTTVAGVAGEDLQRNSRIGATLAVPLTRRQALQFVFSAGAATTVGGDFNSYGVAYQYLWGAGL